ncbi:FAD binding domain-containing protein [Sodiomyces alkalinus F11]|uniref:FAD binding domain-containing protein n=1 Tax=Sodiomyces alkalinus (strain CBS 110278 / VKM F-3762 / F11) TaxID=1314773 RepID=A0A3N2Q4R4_SODAK|nr:FAD binding domain-containing protein [Sodiomyces alkalinus F11]ROT41605.1 FAD binding domain-containing protein [Sodiomyces alkalinus F11]
MAPLRGLSVLVATLPSLAWAVCPETSPPYLGVAVSTCCAALASYFPDSTFARDNSQSSTYYREKTAFWSATEWLDPTCVFLPSSTDEVSIAVSIFSEEGCPFAIRGGGHSAIRGAANIDNGILVSMKRIRDITMSPDNSTVTIGMGLTWSEVYPAIEPLGYMVVGGRFATVGTGLALGAGFSFFANSHGLAIDNVAGHRVVLGNGTVVDTDAEHHPELYWALKGTSNNFGVVTHLTLQTVPHRGMYGGRVTYPPSVLPQLKRLTYQYQVETAERDIDTHVLPSYVYDGATNTTYGFSPIVYNQAVDALPESLQPWLDVEHDNSTIKSNSYVDLAEELVAGFPDGLVQTHFTFTVYPNESYLSYILDKWVEFCSSISHIEGLTGLQTVMPISTLAIEKSGINNPLGLDRAEPGRPLTVFYLGLQFNNVEDIDEVFPAWGVFIRTMEAEAKLQDLLFPYIMLPYSDGTQQAIASYGERNVKRLQEVQERYDPDLVFQRLVTGGQKIPLNPPS